MSKVKMFHEAGRTMIEMLGVISILAMMALGGSIGVSRAIDIWRAWQVEAQVPQLVRDVKSLYAWTEDYGSVGMPLICYNVKVHGAGCNDDDKFVSPWGGQVYVEPINETSEDLGETEPVNKGFRIIYTDVPPVIRNQLLDSERYFPMIAEVKEVGDNLVFSTYNTDDVDRSAETVKCKGEAEYDEVLDACICENGEDPDEGALKFALLAHRQRGLVVIQAPPILGAIGVIAQMSIQNGIVPHLLVWRRMALAHPLLTVIETNIAVIQMPVVQ